MKIPKLLKVGGHEYKIEYPYLFKERLDCDGSHANQKSEILIANIDASGCPLSQSYTECIFWHEVFHAIDKVYCGDGMDEKLVEGLAQGLLQILKDNFKELEVSSSE